MDLMQQLFLFFSILSFCNSFNFETRLPVIKRGSRGSYFGFSVAEHQSFDDKKRIIDNSWLLVGAPRDQNQQPSTNHSGALWRCPITTYHDDCVQVITDGRRSPDNDDLMPPLDDEFKDFQWLGVTVRSQGTGGKVMVCAHRYIRKQKGNNPDYMYGKGLCYTLSQTLEFDNTWEPCKGRPVDLGHEQYGYCQSGTSAILVNDTAIVGSPGPYVWKGTIFVFSVSDDFLTRDKTMYYSPHNQDNSPVGKDSYLGMAVAAGDFFGNGNLAYATGAPRSKGTGEVLIFSIDQISVPQMKEKLRLAGDRFTSNFGYELATADVNGDKLPDLIVGAPNYFDKDVGGAIYIYVNKHEKCSLTCNDPMKITGQPESRFGVAIANLGDINKDGFDDIAVGAPYERKGVVYIYLGSKNGTINEPSQVIDGEQFGLETFGYSLSGGLDLDKNGYPDLLAGAFESEAVVLLRGRPIIEITSNVRPSSALSKIDPNTPGCKEHPYANLTCFTFEACITVQDVSRDRHFVSEGLRLNYTLQTDINRRIPRTFINKDGAVTRPSTIQRIITLKTHAGELEHCHPHTIFVKGETKDIQSEIAMRLSYKLVQKDPDMPKPGDKLPSMEEFPILNQVQADKVFYATFLKDCGENDICESQLSIEASLVDLPRKSRSGKYNFILGHYKEILLNVTVQNLNESAYEATLLIRHSPSLSYVAKVKVNQQTCSTSEKDPESAVECTLGNPLERNEQVNVLLRFEPRSSIENDNEVYFELIANTTSAQLKPQGPVLLTSNVIRKANLSMKASVRPEELLYGGQVRGESAMVYKDQLGSVVRHTYEVVNNGPSPVSNLQIIISWPFQVANNKPAGKWLLYMDEPPAIEVDDGRGGGVCDDTSHVNPLGLKTREAKLLDFDQYSHANSPHPNSLRTKREVEMVVRKEPNNVVKMNCTAGTAKCFLIKCVVNKLYNHQSVTVAIKARLWNSTLVEDYPRVKAVEIASHARLEVPSGIILTSKPSETSVNAVSIAKTGGHIDQQASGGLEIWMIIVAVLLGLLVLIVVILCLWRCGFFKRTRPDPTLSGNLEKHTVDDYHDY